MHALPSPSHRPAGLRLLSLACAALAALTISLPTASALNEEGGIFVFPREYWRLVNDERVVGLDGKLLTVETEDGEEFEVVEYTPPRSAQREKDLLLFSTHVKPEGKPQMLKRPLQKWQNGRFADGEFEQPDLVNRTIYRTGSKAYDEHLNGLYETAQLNQKLAAMSWLAGAAMKAGLIEQPMVKEANSAGQYDRAVATVRKLSDRRDFLTIGAYELGRFAAYRETIAANQMTLPKNQAALAELNTRIAALEAEMGEDQLFDKHHPKWREKELARLDAYEMRAEIRFLEKQIQDLQGRMRATVNALFPPAEGADPAATALPDAAAVPGMIEAVRGLIAQADQALAESPDARQHILRTAKLLDDTFAKPAPADNDKAATVLAQWRAAFPTGLEAALSAELDSLDAATAEIQQLDYGTYQFTMIAQIQGIENCLGTPIEVTVGGVTRTLFQYQWPSADAFHEISYPIDFREPDVWLLMNDKPTPSGRITGYVSSYDQYNDVRLRGWSFSGSTTLSAIADAVFGKGAMDVEKAWQSLLKERYTHNGEFNISVSLKRQQRYTIRGMGGPDASIDAVVLDAFILDPIVEPPIVLRQALAQKNWFRPGEGEAQAFQAWMHNRTDAPQTATLRTFWISDLASEQQIDERQVTVPPHSALRELVPWQPPADMPIWGQEVRMELHMDGVPVQTESDVFSVHPNTFAVMMHDGHLGYHPYRLKKNFVNHNETFSSTFCDSVYVIPDDLVAPYVRSMSDVIGHVIQSRAEAQRNDKLGVASVHYIYPGSTGQKAYEMYKQHPEWFPERLAWTESMNTNHLMVQKIGMEAFYSGDQTDVNKVMSANNPYPLLHLEQAVNMANQQLFDNLVEDLITFSYAVKWDGSRWDGGPLFISGKDFLGRDIKHFETGEPLRTDAQRKDVSAKRLADLKRRVREHHPYWVYGSNGDTFGYGGTLLTLDSDPPPLEDYPSYSEFMADGGSYMDEGWMNAYMYADNRNKAESYMKLAFKQAQNMHMAGGYLQGFSPQRDGAGHFNVDHIYYTLLPHITGGTYYGMMSASPWSQDGPIYFFERFSGIFFDTRSRPLPDAAARVRVDTPDAWSYEIATILPLAKDHVRVVVPIVNKHPRERLYDTQSRYSVLPRTVDEPFAASLQAPEGFADVEPTVWLLTCEPTTSATKLDSTRTGDRTSVDVPGLKLFHVLVYDYRRAN